MKKFALAILLLSQMAAATPLLTPKETYNSFTCKKKITELEKNWGAVGEWKGHVSVEGTMGLLKRTNKFAHWIVVEESNGIETATLMNPGNAQKVVFDKKCKGTLNLYAHNQFSNQKGVNDTKLLKELMNNQKGIIGLWSPGMQHSASAISRIEKVAKDLKLPVLWVMDPFASDKVAKDFLKSRKIASVEVRKNSSLELFYRDSTMHYPAFFVYKNGEIKGNVFPGLMGESQYRDTITTQLGK